MASIIKRTYKVTLPNGETVTKTCSRWTIQYRDDAGKIKRVKGYKDKGATKQLAAKLEAAVARGEQGLVDKFRESKARPIAEQIEEYAADLKSAGRDDKYAYNVEHRLTMLASGCGWNCLAEIEPNSFLRWREKQKTGGTVSSGRSAKGLSATTLNQFLDTARAFLNWCASNGRIAGVPMGARVVSVALGGIGRAEGEKVRKRRGFTDEEAVNMLAVVPNDRSIVYRVGMSLGLRREEINDLQWGDLHLAAIRPYVQLRAQATKARRGDRLDIPQSLAEALRKEKPADAKDGARVFPAGVPSIKQWKDDLAAAKIQYKDDQDRQLDFHGGTRKTLCNRMHRAGVPLAAAMRRMRHTDARLTLIDYADDDGVGLDLATLPELQPAAQLQADQNAATMAGA